MKVGIVTIFDNENMGNRLQNYALQQVLLRYADEVLTLKNKTKFESALDNLKRSSSLAESVLLNRLLGKTRKVKFLQFNKRYIRFSRHCYWFNDPQAAPKKPDLCDLYCAGSDQIWNPLLDRQGMFNFLGFAPKDAAFSYSASFGIDAIPEAFAGDVRKGLEHVNCISVREDAGKQITQDLTGRTDAQVLADPTMLLSAEEWDQVASKPDAPVPERYLLTYFLGSVPDARRAEIRRQAEAMDCHVIELMDPASPFYNIGPGEFLYLIKHAELICTDSFHGSVFSFLWQRPLVIFSRCGGSSNMGSRIQTFTETFHLRDHIAQDDRIPALSTLSDYSAGCEALAAERKKAAAFLEMVFQNARKTSVPL